MLYRFVANLCLFNWLSNFNEDNEIVLDNLGGGGREIGEGGGAAERQFIWISLKLIKKFARGKFEELSMKFSKKN